MIWEVVQLTKFETYPHSDQGRCSPTFPQEHLPLSANQVPRCLDPANERPAQGSRDRSEPRSRDPLDQWETRGAAAPGANGNCRLLVDDSSSTDGQLEEEGEREGFDQDPVTKGAFCNLCDKRFKMVGSVGSPMRSQSLARLHAVGPHVHVLYITLVCVLKARKNYKLIKVELDYHVFWSTCGLHLLSIPTSHSHGLIYFEIFFWYISSPGVQSRVFLAKRFYHVFCWLCLKLCVLTPLFSVFPPPPILQIKRRTILMTFHIMEDVNFWRRRKTFWAILFKIELELVPMCSVR